MLCDREIDRDVIDLRYIFSYNCILKKGVSKCFLKKSERYFQKTFEINLYVLYVCIVHDT